MNDIPVPDTPTPQGLEGLHPPAKAVAATPSATAGPSTLHDGAPTPSSLSAATTSGTAASNLLSTAPNDGITHGGIAQVHPGDAEAREAEDVGSSTAGDPPVESLAPDVNTPHEAASTETRKIAADYPAGARRSRSSRAPRRIDTTHPKMSAGQAKQSGGEAKRRWRDAARRRGLVEVPLGRIQGLDPDVIKEIGLQPACVACVVPRTDSHLEVRLEVRPMFVVGDAEGDGPLYWLANGQDLTSLKQHFGDDFMLPVGILPRKMKSKRHVRFAAHALLVDHMFTPPRTGAGEQINKITRRLEQYNDPPLVRTSQAALAATFSVDPRQLKSAEKTKQVTVPEFPRPPRRGTPE